MRSRVFVTLFRVELLRLLAKSNQFIEIVCNGLQQPIRNQIMNERRHSVWESAFKF